MGAPGGEINLDTPRERARDRAIACSFRPAAVRERVCSSCGLSPLPDGRGSEKAGTCIRAALVTTRVENVKQAPCSGSPGGKVEMSKRRNIGKNAPLEKVGWPRRRKRA